MFLHHGIDAPPLLNDDDCGSALGAAYEARDVVGRPETAKLHGPEGGHSSRHESRPIKHARHGAAGRQHGLIMLPIHTRVDNSQRMIHNHPYVIQKRH